MRTRQATIAKVAHLKKVIKENCEADDTCDWIYEDIEKLIDNIRAERRLNK